MIGLGVRLGLGLGLPLIIITAYCCRTPAGAKTVSKEAATTGSS
jgi:hypothetical protein